MPQRDPREVVTPYAFTVAPHLLGLPLAQPWRRAAAMALDGIALALLSSATSVLLGLAAAGVMLRASGKRAAGGFVRRSLRVMVRGVAAVVLFVVVIVIWGDARSAAGRLLGGSAATPVTSASVATRRAAPPPPAVAEEEAEPLPAAALERIDRLERRNRGLERDLAQARRQQGMVARLWRFADDLGLTIGWAALYFTTFAALWRGRTPGKRLMGVRVVRLNGAELSWWMAFERFGGYAAGFATGLLGFAQILWDPNRQAVHDKIAQTVVVQEKGAGGVAVPHPPPPSPVSPPQDPTAAASPPRD